MQVSSEYFGLVPPTILHSLTILSLTLRGLDTDIGKYSCVNRMIQLWNQLPADAFGTLSCKQSHFWKMFRKVINKAKCSCGGYNKKMQRSEVEVKGSKLW
jgi:hypothetical protein